MAVRNTDRQLVFDWGLLTLCEARLLRA